MSGLITSFCLPVTSVHKHHAEKQMAPPWALVENWTLWKTYST